MNVDVIANVVYCFGFFILFFFFVWFGRLALILFIGLRFAAKKEEKMIDECH